MTLRRTTSFSFDQTGYPIYQINVLVDEQMDSSFVLIEYVVDGLTHGVGGISIEKDRNIITVPVRFIPNKFFYKIYADLFSDNPTSCIVKPFVNNCDFDIYDTNAY